MNENKIEILIELENWLEKTFGKTLKWFDAKKVVSKFVESNECDLNLSFNKLKIECRSWYARYCAKHGEIVNYQD